jgi:hypothetical protein
MFAVNPVLLAVIVLMISRPRPVQNLLAYWLGSMLVNFAGLLIPLMVLHFIPRFSTFSEDLNAPGQTTTARLIQLTMGALMLSVAAAIAVRSARERMRQPVPAGDTSVVRPESETPEPMSSPFGNLPDGATEGGSILRRLLGRLKIAWENGSVWVAFVFGLGGFPPPMLVFIVLTVIVSSGTTVATQFFAVIVFVVVMFAVVEITLVSYLIAPAKTRAFVQPLHDWALAHRRHVLIAILSVVGLISVANGLIG